MVEAAGIEPASQIRNALESQAMFFKGLWRPCGAQVQKHENPGKVSSASATRFSSDLARGCDSKGRQGLEP